MVSFAAIRDSSQSFAQVAAEHCGPVDAVRESRSDNLLSGLTETMRSIVTTGWLLVVLLDNGPTAAWIRPDVPGPPRRVGGGCATAIISPDKAEVSGSSPLRPTPSIFTPTSANARARCVDLLGSMARGGSRASRSSVRRSSLSRRRIGPRARRPGGPRPRPSRPGTARGGGLA